MYRKLSIIFLLCVAMLFPSIASAQFFAKQKVLVWEVRDRNNDVELSRGTKDEIRAKLRTALTKSENYEAYEDVVGTVKNGLTSQSPIEIAKRVRQFYPQIKYIIFTTVKVLEQSNSFDNWKLLLESDLFTVETLKNRKTSAVPMLSDQVHIPDACDKLIGQLLGEGQDSQNNSNQYYVPAQSTHQYSSYNQSQSSYAKTYKVGDYYDANGKQGVVFAINSDGKHGKIVGLNNLGGMNWDSAVSACRNLGNGWRLPSKGELLAIYNVNGALNSTLAAVGDKLPSNWHWSSTESDSDCAWGVYMSTGYAIDGNKYGSRYVRAISAF